MGEPRRRLNPKVESQVNRTLINQAMNLLLLIVLLLPIKTSNKRGLKPYDYREIIALCILRILLRKTYTDYEKEMRKRECDKVHLAVCADLLLILNWKITNGRRHDCQFFVVLLKPFKWLGNVIADKGYLSRVNFQFVYDRKGQAYIPFKKGKKKGSTDSPKSHPAWKFAFHFWKTLNGIYMCIYHQRSRIEAVFSAIKKRYGDKLNCKNARMRRKEMSLRLIAYNIRILICTRHAKKNNLPLWVKVE